MPVRYKIKDFFAAEYTIANGGSGYTAGNRIDVDTSSTYAIIDTVDGSGSITSLKDFRGSSTTTTDIDPVSTSSFNLVGEDGTFYQERIVEGDSTQTQIEIFNSSKEYSSSFSVGGDFELIDYSYDGKTYQTYNSSTNTYDFIREGTSYSVNKSVSITKFNDGYLDFNYTTDETIVGRWTGSGYTEYTLSGIYSSYDSVDLLYKKASESSFSNGKKVTVDIAEWNGSSYSTKTVEITNNDFSYTEIGNGQDVTINKNGDVLVIVDNYKDILFYYTLSGTSTTLEDTVTSFTGLVRAINDVGDLLYTGGSNWYYWDGSQLNQSVKDDSPYDSNAITPDLLTIATFNSGTLTKTIKSVSSKSDTTFTNDQSYTIDISSGTSYYDLFPTLSKSGDTHYDIIKQTGTKSESGTGASVNVSWGIGSVELQNTNKGRNIKEFTISFSGDSPTTAASDEVVETDSYFQNTVGSLPEEVTIKSGSGYTDSRNITVTVSNIIGKF